MNAGDKLREKTGRNDAAVLALLRYVQEARAAITGDRATPATKATYVIHSLKTPEEIKTLRAIYAERFIAIGAHAPRSVRVGALARKIAETHHTHKSEGYFETADHYIHRDQEGSQDNPFGQSTSQAFPLADVFVDASTADTIRAGLRPFMELLFSNPFVTPSRDEHAMFHAFGASLRSASLSRQVGASIALPEGEILALGTNEVPKAGGGTYWQGDEPDGRDFRYSPRDLSHVMRENILANVLERLVEAGWKPPPSQGSAAKSGDTEEATLGEVLQSQLDVLKDDSAAELVRLKRSLLVEDLIEFHRGLHAETAAIVEAAARGASLRGATLYCRTYPCHLCAPLIVGSGITRVVFLEPYPKSLVSDFYGDSIASEGRASESQVLFEPFVGIAPRRYGFFDAQALRRKDREGTVLAWREREAQPRPDLFTMTSNDAFFEDLARTLELRQSVDLETAAINTFDSLAERDQSSQDEEAS
jgi:deoxycytidylate deaminase